MGNIFEAIHDDIEEYENLCRKYGEKVQTTKTSQGHAIADCYGEHASELKARQEREWQAIRQAEKAAKGKKNKK